MRHLAALLIAAVLAVPLRAEPVAFSYAWELTVYTVGADGQGNPVVIPSHSPIPGWSGALTWSPAAAGSASAPAWSGVDIPAATFTHIPRPPDHATIQVAFDERAALTLTLTDAASGESGSLTFDGVIGEGGV